MVNTNLSLHRKGSANSLAAFLKAAFFICAATLPTLAAAMPTDLDIHPGTTPNDNIFKRSIIAQDQNWCHGKVHQSQGEHKPRAAVCRWNEGRAYKVLCQPADAPAGATSGYWIDGSCDPGFYCKQLEDVKIWTGRSTLDVDCVPERTLVKWALGSRQLGQSYTKYCSDKYTYTASGGGSPLWEFFTSFYGETGQITQILNVKILLNDKVIQERLNGNALGTRHNIGPKDHVQFCGVRGSESLIEGFATAKVVGFKNALGQEETTDKVVNYVVAKVSG